MSENHAASIKIDRKDSKILRNVGNYYRSTQHHIQEIFNLHALELRVTPVYAGTWTRK
jgi:Ni,Fe-hydrogenase I large subunit